MDRANPVRMLFGTQVLSSPLRWYRYINALSLDVVAGSLICALYFNKQLGVHLTVYPLAALGLAVWIIYTVDHLWDASRSSSFHTFRHAFHKRHFSMILGAVLVAAFSGALILHRLPVTTRNWGIALIIMVLVYYSIIHGRSRRNVYHKELLIGLLYSMGVFLGPLSVYEGHFTFEILLTFFQFTLLALINLLIFSLFELESDRKQNFRSMVTLLGSDAVQVIITVLVAALVTLLIFGWFWAAANPALRTTQALFAGMLGILVFILTVPGYFRINDRFRYLGDGVFIIPLFWL